MGSDGTGTEFSPPPGSTAKPRRSSCSDALGIFVIGVQRAPVLQRRHQDLAVLLGHRLVQRALPGALGQKLGDMAMEVGLDLAIALRLAAESLGGMDIGVVIDLGEGLERHAQAVHIMQDALMVIGQAPGTGIDVLARIEADCWVAPPSSV